MKMLVFDIEGDYGHFGTYFSTTSPLTFSIIPPTSLMGLIGAILGYQKEKNKYLKILNDAGVVFAVKLIKPIKKVHIGLNLIKTKGNIWVPKQRREGARTQIRYEFLKDVAYRIYFYCTDRKVYKSLAEFLKDHKSVYTISLGLSELLCNYDFVGEFTYENVLDNKEWVEIDSVIPMSMLYPDGLKFSDGMNCLKERMPARMDENRIVSNYEEFIFSQTGSSLTAKIKEYVRINDKNIVMLKCY